MVRLIRHLLGRNIAPLSAQFVHHRSGDLRPIRAATGCEVQFDSSRDEIQFDRSTLDLPLLGQDPYLNQLMCEACEAALAGSPQVRSSFRTEVENKIAPLLPHAEADVRSVSTAMGLSERTFARRMAAEGLSFSGILDDMRRELAARYLKDPSLQIAQVAWLLGFRHPSAFSRACRRWFRRSPTDLRQEALERHLASCRFSL